MPKVLITGAAGFMGSHVADKCLELGFEVHGIDDLSGGFSENVPRGIRFSEMSILDQEAISRLFSENKFDYVFHLAAYAAEGLSHFIRRFNYSNNLIGSVNLINASVKHGVKRFIFTSSIAVYGSAQVPMTEETKPAPEDPYGIAKYAVEMDLESAHNLFGLEYVIFRPHNVYGERQNIADNFRNVIGIFMRQISQGMPVTVFGDGLQTRAFTYIDDVSHVIARAAEHKGVCGEVFNIGADEPRTVLDAARLIAQAFGAELKIEWCQARHEVINAYASHSKIREFFGESKPISLEEGLAKMANWFKRASKRAPVKYRGIELWEKLPGTWRPVVE
ncbi:MAG: NAD-dependent epimerase/dehydratase family protein [Desulfomonile tiedjei]|uniref:NAD-dependent epimerase/dehydratase family protein n=1 Tax=Desulfomonile tiedjei TaxID=2358 RepID=A0A9D6V1T7_9BACT|nr:NAD-dependent epimerase/dehydratase family protein [Desulfomonile tiedjei]